MPELTASFYSILRVRVIQNHTRESSNNLLNFLKLERKESQMWGRNLWRKKVSMEDLSIRKCKISRSENFRFLQTNFSCGFWCSYSQTRLWAWSRVYICINLIKSYIKFILDMNNPVFYYWAIKASFLRSFLSIDWI